MASSFGQVGAWLTGAAAQQTDLQRAVAAGELWMEAGVAERAAARCDQAVEEINDWLARGDRLTWRRKFGANEDGAAAADLAAAAAILDKPHARAGQIAANVRDSLGQVRRSDVLRWCHNVDGHYHMTVNRRSGESTSMTIGP
ncbi:MAG: ESX secretion-associated protein EspG [Actinomycetota bacterium]|nr:ESX secretion-associated protein EspG [Actinomycetota bacterium]